MKEIQLTQGKVTFVDDEDYEYLSQFSWHTLNNGYTSYAVRKLSPKKGEKKRKVILMHREILGNDSCDTVDHIDGNGLNNTKSNIRIATFSQNSANSKKTKGISKYKGVTWLKKNKKWRAEITIKGKSKHLGCFTCEEDAAEAYNQAALMVHCEFAKLNLVTKS